MATFRNIFFKISLVIILLFGIQRSYAEEMYKWYMVTDAEDTIDLEEVDFLFSTDQDFDKFTITTNKNEIYSGVSSIKFVRLKEANISNVKIDTPIVTIRGNNLFISFMRDYKSETLVIYDLNGRGLLKETVNGSDLAISIESLSPGFYILSLGENSIKFKKHE